MRDAVVMAAIRARRDENEALAEAIAVAVVRELAVAFGWKGG